MATLMSATMVIASPNIIGGQKATATLTLTESGGTATNLVSVQPYITTGAGQLAGGARIGTVANATTIAGYTGAAMTLGANSSTTINFEFVIDNPPIDGAPSEPYQTYLVGAVCQTSDGSVFSPQAQLVAITLPATGPSSSSPAPNGLLGQSITLGSAAMGQPNNAYGNVDAPGSLNLDLGPNTYFIPFFA